MPRLLFLALALWAALPFAGKADMADFVWLFAANKKAMQWFQHPEPVPFSLTIKPDVDSLAFYPFTDTGGNRYSDVVVKDSAFVTVAVAEKRYVDSAHAYYYFCNTRFARHYASPCTFGVYVIFGRRSVPQYVHCFRLQLLREK